MAHHHSLTQRNSIEIPNAESDGSGYPMRVFKKRLPIMLTGRSAAEPKLLTAKPLKEIVSKLSPSGKDTRARQSLQQLKNQHAKNGA